jgi:hypothetical protein
MHTKGKWEVRCLVENDYDPRHVEVMSGRRLIAKAYYGKTDEECAYNARLIAAAPKLLAACKSSLSAITERLNKDGDAYLEEMNALALLGSAINKAEGN